MFAISLTIATVCFTVGWYAGRSETREKAIAANAGKYYIDNNGNKQWMWNMPKQQ